MSLLCEVSEAVFLLSVIRLALIRYLERHTADDIAKAGQYPVSEARSSGFLFGLTALGRCALRIPPAVLRIEVPPLAPLVSEVSLRAYVKRCAAETARRWLKNLRGRVKLLTRLSSLFKPS